MTIRGTRKRESAGLREFRERYGPAALVTGAAQGIGRAFAEGLAARGLALHLIDVQADAISETAAAIAEDFEVVARPIALDLAEDGFLEELLRALAEDEADTRIGLLICNAAIGLEGPFLEMSLDALQRAVDVNCRATMALCHAFGERMRMRGRGGIILIASGTALQGSPGFANYAATKAFDLSLGESLAFELEPLGIDVLSFVPGPTNTPGFRKSVPGLAEGERRGPIGLPAETAEAALAALGRRASAARERGHAQQLAARRRRAEAIVARNRRRASKAADSRPRDAKRTTGAEVASGDEGPSG